MDTSRPQLGDVVRIQGLTESVQYNGLLATIQELNAEKDQIQVKITDESYVGVVFKISIANISVMSKRLADEADDQILPQPNIAGASFESTSSKVCSKPSSDFADEQLLAVSNFTMGMMLHRFGDYERSVRLLSRSLEIYERVDNREMQGRVCLIMGMALVELRELDEAERMLTKALIFTQAFSKEFEESQAFGCFGKLHALRGNSDLAIKMEKDSIKILLQLETCSDDCLKRNELSSLVVKHELILRYLELFEVLLADELFDEAISVQEGALVVRKSLNDTKGVAESYLHFGRVYARMQKNYLAQHNFQLSLNLHLEIGEMKRAGICQHHLGCLYTKLCMYDEATELCTKGVENLRKFHDFALLGSCLKSLGEIHILTGLFDQAAVALKEAAAAFGKCSDEQSVAEIQNLLTEVLLKSNEVELKLAQERSKGPPGFVPSVKENDDRAQICHKPEVGDSGERTEIDNAPNARSKSDTQSTKISIELLDFYFNSPNVKDATVSLERLAKENAVVVDSVSVAEILSLDKGSRVRIAQLRNRPEYNGLFCVVDSVALQEKLVVRVDDPTSRFNGTLLKLSRENLKKIINDLPEYFVALKEADQLRLDPKSHCAFDRACQLYELLDNAKSLCCSPTLVSDFHLRLGLFHLSYGNIEIARKNISMALDITRDSDSPPHNLVREQEGACLHALGKCYLRELQTGAALECFKSAQQLFESLGNLKHSCQACMSLCIAYLLDLQPESAHLVCEKMLDIVSKTGNSQIQAQFVDFLGLAYLESHLFHQSADMFEMASELFENLGDSQNQSSSLFHLALVHSKLGNLDVAIKVYLKLRTFAVESANNAMRCDVDLNIGKICLSIGDHPKADYHLSDCWMVAKSIPDHHRTGSALLSLGTLRYAMGELEQAIADFSMAQSEFNLSGHRAMECKAIMQMCQIQCLHKTHVPNDTLQNVEQLCAICDQNDFNKHHKGMMLSFAAEALDICGRHDSALKIGLQANELLSEVGRNRDFEQLFRRLSRIYANLGEYDKSTEMNSRRLSLLDVGEHRGKATVKSIDDKNELLLLDEFCGLDEQSPEIVVKCPIGHPLRRSVREGSFKCNVCYCKWFRGDRFTCIIEDCSYSVCMGCVKCGETNRKETLHVERGVLQNSNDVELRNVTKCENIKKESIPLFVSCAAIEKRTREGKYGEALEQVHSTLELARSLGDLEVQHTVCVQSSWIHFHLAEYDECMKMGQEALRLGQTMGHIDKEANAQTVIGNCFRGQGKYAQAIDAFQKVLALFSLVHEKSIANEKRFALTNIGIAYLNLGSVYNNVAEYQRAIEMHENALKIGQETCYLDLEMRALGNLGTVYFNFGQYDRSEKMHLSSLELRVRSRDKRGQGKILQSLGMVCINQGRLDEARQYLEKSLKIRREINDIQGEGRLLMSLGDLYSKLKLYRLALSLTSEGHKIATERGDLHWQFYSMFQMSRLHEEQGDVDLAGGSYRTAIQFLSQLEDSLERSDELRVSLFEGGKRCYLHFQQLLVREKKFAEALEIAGRSKARALSFLLGSQSVSGSSCKDINSHQRDEMLLKEGFIIEYSLLPLGQLAVWLSSSKSGLITQMIHFDEMVFSYLANGYSRENCTPLSECHRKVMMEVWPHDLEKDKNIRLGRPLSILLNIFRCAALMQQPLLGRNHSDVDGDDLLTQRAKQYLSRKHSVRFHFSKCPIGHGLQLRQDCHVFICDHCQATVSVEGVRLSCKRGLCDYDICPSCIEQKFTAQESELHSTPHDCFDISLVAKLQQEHEEVCEVLKVLACMEGYECDQDELLDALEIIRTQVVCWDDFITIDHSFLAAHGVNSEIVSKTLVTRISQIFDADRILRFLHQLLIEPVYDFFDDDSSVLIIPDMELFMVPWCALRDGQGRFLVEKATVRLAPSLSVAWQVSNEKPAESSTPKFCVVGNPTLSPKLQEQFPILPHAQDEMHAVAARLGVRGLGGQHASKASVMGMLMGAQHAHLACHGWLERSALVLSGENEAECLLTALEVRDQLRLAAGCCVVLSACDSGRGQVRGEGVVGLSRSFLAAGAGCVIMSLWSIPDNATKMLMDDFYASLLRGCSAPTALRRAMLAALKRGGASARPHAWAGFVVTGGRGGLVGRLSLLDVEEVAAMLVKGGLNGQAESIRADQVDGKTLCFLSEEELRTELNLSWDVIWALAGSDA